MVAIRAGKREIQIVFIDPNPPGAVEKLLCRLIAEKLARPGEARPVDPADSEEGAAGT